MVEPTTRAGATELLTLVAALNHHDPLTRGHSERVRALSDLLAEQLQMSAEDREKLRWAALLHDIGKLRVPGEILRKPGKPTADEWALLKTHPAEGLELIRGPLADWLGDWARAIGEHHEQFDGSGYPAGLSGTDISYAGRLVAVADVFDVITATRSYKKAMTVQEARLEITRCAGSQFDPDMVRAFLQISIGDLRKAMGPLSWIAQLSIFGRLAAAPAASTMAGTMIAVTGLGLGPVTSVYSEPAVPPTRVAHTTVVSDPSTTNTLEIGSSAASDGSTNSPGGGEADPIASSVLPADHADETGTERGGRPAAGNRRTDHRYDNAQPDRNRSDRNHAAGHHPTAQGVDRPRADDQHPDRQRPADHHRSHHHRSHHHPGDHGSADHDSDCHDSDLDRADQYLAHHTAAHHRSAHHPAADHPATDPRPLNPRSTTGPRRLEPGDPYAVPSYQTPGHRTCSRLR